jgi:hypothetical protein
VRKGSRHTPETIERMREAHRGKKRSPETKAKLSRSMSKFWADVHALQAAQEERERGGDSS